MEYIFLAGVHAVGKSTLQNKIAKDSYVINKSVSDLIRSAGNSIKKSDKLTSHINKNQDLWKEELKNITLKPNEQLILDGHFSLLNKKGNIIELPDDTFKGTKIVKIILKKENPQVIQERLKLRDGSDWSLEKITDFQNSEEKQAKKFAELYNLPIFIYDNDDLYNELLEYIRN